MSMSPTVHWASADSCGDELRQLLMADSEASRQVIPFVCRPARSRDCFARPDRHLRPRLVQTWTICVPVKTVGRGYALFVVPDCGRDFKIPVPEGAH